MKITIVILAIALIIVSYIAFKPSPAPENTSLIERRVLALDSINNQLLGDLKTEQTRAKQLSTSLDSLKVIKNKPIIIYVDKTKRIDSASASYVLGDFNRIFTEGGIK